jgi:hypothetical protein
MICLNDEFELEILVNQEVIYEKNLSLRLKMMKFQFDLLIYENYSLVPEL